MNKILRWEKINFIEDGCGGLIYKILDVENSELKNIEMSMCIFEPGEIAKLHYHKVMEEIYFVLEGNGEIEIDGEWLKIKKEDCIAIPVGVKHRIRNTGKQKQLKFLSINSPYWQNDDMILIGERFDMKKGDTEPVKKLI